MQKWTFILKAATSGFLLRVWSLLQQNILQIISTTVSSCLGSSSVELCKQHRDQHGCPCPWQVTVTENLTCLKLNCLPSNGHEFIHKPLLHSFSLNVYFFLRQKSKLWCNCSFILVSWFKKVDKIFKNYHLFLYFFLLFFLKKTIGSLCDFLTVVYN